MNLPADIKFEFGFLNANLIVPESHRSICTDVEFSPMERPVALLVRLLALTVLLSIHSGVVQTHFNSREAVVEVATKAAPKACGISVVS